MAKTLFFQIYKQNASPLLDEKGETKEQIQLQCDEKRETISSYYISNTDRKFVCLSSLINDIQNQVKKGKDETKSETDHDIFKLCMDTREKYYMLENSVNVPAHGIMGNKQNKSQYAIYTANDVLLAL